MQFLGTRENADTVIQLISVGRGDQIGGLSDEVVGEWLTGARGSTEDGFAKKAYAGGAILEIGVASVRCKRRTDVDALKPICEATEHTALGGAGKLAEPVGSVRSAGTGAGVNRDGEPGRVQEDSVTKIRSTTGGAKTQSIAKR
jgi:hypothetical protein